MTDQCAATEWLLVMNSHISLVLVYDSVYHADSSVTYGNNQHL